MMYMSHDELKSVRQATLLAIMVLVVLTLWRLPAYASGPKVDFKLLYHAAQLSNRVYYGKSKIIGAYPGRSAWVATPGNTDVQYALLHNEKRKNQVIAVRGTVDDTNWASDRDTLGVRDKKAGILMHRGFKTIAEAIYRDMKPRLRRGYTTYLTGHSLGGAVAAILGIYLVDDGYKVAGIYTFGQPKFTNAAGAKAYAELPLLRVIYQNDVVATFPDKTKDKAQLFAHVGPAVNLFPGPYYSYVPANQALKISQGSMGRFLTQVSVPDHKMKWYLQGLRDKLKNARRVSLKDRNRYILRHKYGRGVDTVRPEMKYNFNRRH
jgi:hypothetical protein